MGGSLFGLCKCDSIEGLYSDLLVFRAKSRSVADPPAGRDSLMANRGRLDPLWAIVVLAVALRVAVMAWRPGAFDDPDNYLPLAQSLAKGEGFVLNGRATAYRPPLYPLMLAPLVSRTGNMSYPGIALLHLALGAGTVWLTAMAARGFGLSRGRSLFCGLHRRLRSRSGVAKPVGDDRDTDGLSAGTRVCWLLRPWTGGDRRWVAPALV